MGRATDPWRAAETWIRCLASHSIPLHAATGLSAHPEVARLPAEPSTCDRCDRCRRSRPPIGRRPRMDHASCRRATKVRDGIPCRLIEPSSTLRPLWPYHSSNRADRRFTQRRCVPGSSAVKPSNRPPFDLASRRLSPYRSRASPRRKLPGISAHDHPLSRAEPSGPQFLDGDCTVRLPRTIRNTAKVCSKR